MTDPAPPAWPAPAVGADHVEPVGRRVRAEFAGRTVLATERALLLWEWPAYPQYLIPAADVDPAALVVEERTHRLSRGLARDVGLRVGDRHRPAAGRRYDEPAIAAIRDHIRFDWDALDAWFEEEEQVFVHPRSPYVRVDALRSSRHVRIECDGVLLAETRAPVMVFETGLPPRTYVDRSTVDFRHLVPSETVTACPYKGRTTDYWSVRTPAGEHADLAWSYSFPTRQLLPIAGLVAFLDERVDVTVDGVAQPRPSTHFS
jgi:uncharacterized protein (DUF427 family)